MTEDLVPGADVPPAGRRLRSGVQLIAYADRFGGSIAGLHRLLHGPLAGVFEGVHLLPFFPPFDGADAGFDPMDHTRVDDRLGTWDDVNALSQCFTVMADLIVNHVSADSTEFRSVIESGAASPFSEMFLTYSDVFPGGATESELAAIYRPRPGLPFTPMTLGDERRLVWTTFTGQQVDIDVRSAAGLDYLLSVISALAGGGVRMMRLDAVGYAVKTAGTSSFMTDATFDFIRKLTGLVHGHGAQVLVEVHAHHAKQIAIAAEVDLVYDFALPPLLLHSLTTADVDPLLQWLRIRPNNAVTVLDTHDGIGVIDVGPDQTDPAKSGLLTADQVDRLVQGIHLRTNGESQQATGWAAANVDLYQVNSTYYDALGRDDARYLLARAIQFFIPGIPQVYYVGLLAGLNDMDLLVRTGTGRDINRHHYSEDEVESELRRPIVRSLLALIRFRNEHPAFSGEVGYAGGEGGIAISWTNGRHRVVLEADLATMAVTLDATPHRDFVTTWEDIQVGLSF